MSRFNGKHSGADSHGSTLGESVSNIVTLVAVNQFPELGVIGMGANPATQWNHEFRERVLAPLFLTTTGTHDNTVTTINLSGGGASYMRPGTVLQVVPGTGADPGADEYMRITAAPDNDTLTVVRGVANAAASIADGDRLQVVTVGAPEGRTTEGDYSVPSVMQSNHCQIIDAPIELSGSLAGSSQKPVGEGIVNEKRADAVTECLRDLTRSVLIGKQTGANRNNRTATTMNGLRSSIVSIVETPTAANFASDPFKEINVAWRKAWENGARDIDTVFVGTQWKEEISASQQAIARKDQTANVLSRNITVLDGDFGRFNLVVTPFLSPTELIGISSQRTFITALAGRSFQTLDIARQGDSMQQLVVGEYTLEVHSQHGMFRMQAS